MTTRNETECKLQTPMIMVSSDRFIANRSSIRSLSQKHISSQLSQPSCINHDKENNHNNNDNKEYRQLLKRELFKYLTPSPPSLYDSYSNNINIKLSQTKCLDFKKINNDKISPTFKASTTCIKKRSQIYMKRISKGILKKKKDKNKDKIKPNFVYKISKKYEIIDDFYSSILDWNHRSNSLIFGVQSKNKSDLMLYDLENKYFSTKINDDNNNNIITSVKVNNRRNIIIYSRNNGDLSIYDLYKNKKIFHHNYDNAHIGCIENYKNEYILFGSKLNNNLHILDYRASNKKGGDSVLVKLKTKGSVSIRMNPDNMRFGISGRGDKSISIYDIRYLLNRVYCLKYHKSSIRAIKWSQTNSNILLSGGGSNDKKIAIWNLTKKNQQNFIKYKSILINKPISIINTKSQITNLYWLSNKNICSIHGYDENNINLWNTEKLKKYNDSSLCKIKKRLLYSCFINDNKIVTLGCDQQIRFWNIFNNEKDYISSSFSCNDLR